MLKADVLIDLLWGDNGKGKISHALTEQGNFTHCIKINGSHNSGHFLHHKGKKFNTHIIPAGVFHGIKSIIGHGCVVNPEKFLEEVAYLETNGINCRDLVKISKATHIITKEHILEDSQDTKIGTTKQGNGPAYRDKYARTGLRAESIDILKPYLIDLYGEFYSQDCYIFCEGAQGFQLDIDSDNYPFVTSSHCSTAAVLINNIPFNAIEKVYGVIKSYATYVGTKDFQPSDQIFKQLQQVGQEFGATTGRVRKTNWNDLRLIEKSILINGVTHLIVNKMDVLEELETWKLYDFNGTLVSYQNEDDFKGRIVDLAYNLGIKERNVIFSYSPEKI